MSSEIDLHIHTNASDGTYSPNELVKKIQEAGIKIFAVTDHDTINGAINLKKILDDKSLIFIKGIEFSTRIQKTEAKCHILGLNYDENHPAFQNALNAGANLRHEKFFRRIGFLRENFNITFTDSELENLLKIPSVGKPHLGNLLVAKGYASNRADAIENFINKCKTGNDKIEAELAIKSINDSGGVSVWAHPLGGEREAELSKEKFQQILKNLISFGLKGLECYYSKYEFSKCEWLAEQARLNNLLISGGSDCHGANKSIPLGKLNAEDKFVNQRFLTIIEKFKN
ncbi:MAG: PHP domain-containing protein [Synergistaceae bacterium]|nr:PHP domain-containing protein [Synergistaceae bacterium]